MKSTRKRGTPVEASDGRRFVSCMEAARAIVAESGCGDVDKVKSCIFASIRRGGTAYGLRWKYIEECSGCEYAGVPTACPTEWSWPEYPSGVCRKGDAR